MDRKLFGILWIFLVTYDGVRVTQARDNRGSKFRIINLEKIENCDVADNLAIKFFVLIKKPAINKLELYGDFVITEVIPGPLYLLLTAYRCDIQLTNCNNYNQYKVPQVCNGLLIKNVLMSPMVDKIKPPITCPMQIGNYSLHNGTWDMTIMNGLPLEGYRWLFVARLFDESRKKPYKVFCIKTQTYVTFGHRNSGT